MARQRRFWTARTRERLRPKTVAPEPHQHPQLRRRIAHLENEHVKTRKSLEARLNDLEESLHEQRRLSLRIAELTDLVTELVGAAARGGADEFEHVLSRYEDSL
jgi:uncharacterized coiled-coil protein SlyX